MALLIRSVELGKLVLVLIKLEICAKLCLISLIKIACVGFSAKLGRLFYRLVASMAVLRYDVFGAGPELDAILRKDLYTDNLEMISLVVQKRRAGSERS